MATDEECKALLAATEAPGKTATASRSQKLRAGKHNMAKGALRPEDAAVSRLISIASISNVVSRHYGSEQRSIGTPRVDCRA